MLILDWIVRAYYAAKFDIQIGLLLYKAGFLLYVDQIKDWFRGK